jgi:HSP20 family molecular chaperone IbpA
VTITVPKGIKNTEKTLKNISKSWHDSCYRIITMYYTLTYKYQSTNDGLVFNIELAGKAKEDVKIFKEDDALAVHVNDNKYHINYEDFISIHKYDFNSVKAKMKNGLLTITVPSIKKEQKRIDIE